jgi:hypothetical protein
MLRAGVQFTKLSVILHIFCVFAGSHNTLVYAELASYDKGCVTFVSSYSTSSFCMINSNVNSP